MKSFNLNGAEYGPLNPYVIAEIGVNHEGDLDRARRLIDQAAAGGAHAAKFQTYKAETLATRDTSPAYWDQSEEAADSQFALFKRWDVFGPDEYRALADHCAVRGVDFLSTPFDLDSVDWLSPMMPLIKIASADLTNLPLLRKVAAAGRPVIMSVGAARMEEVSEAVGHLEGAGARDITLLHCVLNYPTPPAQARLAQIPELQRLFGDRCAIGYSDHVKPDADGAMPALEMAAMMGAVVLEKHFTDDKTGVGNDHYHAMTSADLRAFMDRLADWRRLRGEPGVDLAGQGQAVANARRRIVSRTDIAEGDVLDADRLIPLRSNTGIEIARWDEVVGRRAARPIAAGAPLDWPDLA